MNEPSLVRRGLDLLLSMHPFFDVIDVDYQRQRIDGSGESVVVQPAGPWVLVRLGQPSEVFSLTRPVWAIWEFAIWKRTGAVYRMSNGAVEDDPFIKL